MQGGVGPVAGSSSQSRGPDCASSFWECYRSLNQHEGYLGDIYRTIDRDEHSVEYVANEIRNERELAGGRLKVLVVFYEDKI